MTMSIQEKLAARAAQAIVRQGDQNEVQAGGGGGDYTPPHAGKAKARLVGYIELGPQANKKEPAREPLNKFKLLFQLYGKNADGQEWVRNDGKPMQIESRPYSVSRGEKAIAVQMWKRMCPKADAAHFMELLGRAFWVEIEHNIVPSTKEGQKDLVFANIKEAEVKPAVRDVLDDDDNVIGQKEIAVPVPGDEDFVIFEWDVPSKEDFERLTKGQQTLIRKGAKFKGSALEALVGGNPATTDAPEDETPEQDDEPPFEPDTKPVEEVKVDESQLPDL